MYHCEKKLSILFTENCLKLSKNKCQSITAE